MAYGPSRKDHDRHFDIIGFAPDADLDTPGAASVMNGVIPTERGWAAAPGLDHTERFWDVPGGYASAPTQAYFSRTGHVIVKVGSQVIRHSPGTGGTSNTATGALTLASFAPQAFVDFGVYVLMGGTHTLATLSATTFVAITGAPVNIFNMVGAARFLMAFDLGSGWQCSARDNIASWTLSPATLASSGSLPGLPDDTNKTAVAMGDDIILFKGQTAYRGRFVPGNEEVWVFERLPIDINAHYFRASCSYKHGILVLADDGLYFYDGAALTNLMEDRMARWFALRVLGDVFYNKVVVDEVRDLIWVTVLLYDDDTLTTYSTRVMICDPKTKRWSNWNGAPISGVESGFHFFPGSFSGLFYSKRSSARAPWALNGTAPYIPREIGAVATANAIAEITLNDFGDAFVDTELTRASLKFTSAPTGTLPVVTYMHRNTLDAALTTATPIARAPDGLFDVRMNARWHRLEFDIRGDFELSGYAVESDAKGIR